MHAAQRWLIATDPDDTGERASVGRGRPGARYRRGPATDLHPAMLRPDT